MKPMSTEQRITLQNLIEALLKDGVSPTEVEETAEEFVCDWEEAQDA